MEIKNSVHKITQSGAFNLIELLVTLGILAILIGLAGTAYRSIVKRAEITTELTAGRQLITAYQAYASENNGILLTGYQTVSPQAVARDGSKISGAAAYRYLWRLAPYVNYDISGAMLINEMKHRFPNPHLTDLQYQVSISPSFGINSHCIGGYTNDEYQTGLATRSSQIAGGIDLIVFASAGRVTGGELIPGNHEVTPPTARGKEWSTMNPKIPSNTGSVHFRYDNKAVVVHYGGHITLESESELKDMRKWNIAALQANDPSFPLSRY